MEVAIILALLMIWTREREKSALWVMFLHRIC